MVNVHSLCDKLMIRLHGPVYRKRIEVLIGLIVPHLNPGDRVRDVGCGSGMLGASQMAHASCPSSVQVHGLERVERGGQAIPVEACDGTVIPYDDKSFEVIIGKIVQTFRSLRSLEHD